MVHLYIIDIIKIQDIFFLCSGDNTGKDVENDGVDVCIKVTDLLLCGFIADQLARQSIGGIFIHSQVILLPNQVLPYLDLSIIHKNGCYPPLGPFEDLIQIIGDVKQPLRSSLIVKGFYTFEDLEECGCRDVYHNKASADDNGNVDDNVDDNSIVVVDEDDYCLNDEAIALKYDLIEAATKITPTSLGTCVVSRAMIHSSQPTYDNTLNTIEQLYYIEFYVGYFPCHC